MRVEEERRKATRYVNFIKHADRDPAKLLVGFSDLDNDAVCRAETGKVAKGLPIEGQVYEAWFFATPDFWRFTPAGSSATF